MSYELYPLYTIISRYGEVTTKDVLSRFRCSIDLDRETYLHEKAIMMEKKAMSRTYVAIENNMHVVGYFSEE